MMTRDWIFPVLLLGLCVAPASCAKKPDDATPAQADVGEGLPSEQKIALEALTAQVDDESWTFPRAEVAREANQPLFIHLATKSSKPELIAASLSALQTSRTRASALDDGTANLLLKQHLGSSEPRVLGPALRLAASAVAAENPDAEVVAQITKLATQLSGGAERYAVLQVLGKIPVAQRNETVSQALLAALDAEQPYVVSAALHGIERGHRSFEDRAAVRAKVAPLLRHADAGVRGRALSLLVLLDQSAPDVNAMLLTALADESPYVRAEACGALAKVEFPAAIHALLPLLEDSREAQHVTTDIPTLEGHRTRFTHRTSDETVREAALRAIDDLAGKPLSLPHLPKVNREPAVAKSVALVREWYAENQAQLPKLDGAKPAPEGAPTNAK